jgi:hypothetical protein
MRRVTFFLALAAGHFALSLGLFTALWMVAERFASHGGSGPIVRGFDFVMQVLWFPVVSLMSQRPAVLRSLGPAGKYLPFVVNSFVWAAVLTAVVTAWRRRRRAG